MTHPLRTVIRHFDGWLSHIEGVEVFCDDPRVIIRIQRGQATRPITLQDSLIAQGEMVLLLHTDNDRMPLIPREGADLAYGLRLHRLLVHSWRAVAGQVEADATLADIRALGGISALFRMEKDGGASMMRSYGFTQLPCPHPGGAFAEFWRNFYAWWLMWTYNPASVKHLSMLDLERTEFWISKESFLEKYGSR